MRLSSAYIVGGENRGSAGKRGSAPPRIRVFPPIRGYPGRRRPERGWAGLTDQPTGTEGQSINPANPVLTPKLKAGLAALTSIGDDADGLTNTEEQW